MIKKTMAFWLMVSSLAISYRPAVAKEYSFRDVDISLNSRVSEVKSILNEQRGEFFGHLLGDIDENTRKIRGGMHIFESFLEYVDAHPTLRVSDVSVKSVMDDGVIAIWLDDDYFTKKARENMESFAESDGNEDYQAGIKTFFPIEWSRYEIVNIVFDLILQSYLSNEIQLDGKKFSKIVGGVSKQKFTIERQFGDINICISFADGKLVSAYPKWKKSYLQYLCSATMNGDLEPLLKSHKWTILVKAGKEKTNEVDEIILRELNSRFNSFGLIKNTEQLKKFANRIRVSDASLRDFSVSTFEVFVKDGQINNEYNSGLIEQWTPISANTEPSALVGKKIFTLNRIATPSYIVIELLEPAFLSANRLGYTKGYKARLTSLNYNRFAQKIYCEIIDKKIYNESSVYDVIISDGRWFSSCIDWNSFEEVDPFIIRNRFLADVFGMKENRIIELIFKMNRDNNPLN